MTRLLCCLVLGTGSSLCCAMVPRAAVADGPYAAGYHSAAAPAGWPYPGAAAWPGGCCDEDASCCFALWANYCESRPGCPLPRRRWLRIGLPCYCACPCDPILAHGGCGLQHLPSGDCCGAESAEPDPNTARDPHSNAGPSAVPAQPAPPQPVPVADDEDTASRPTAEIAPEDAGVFPSLYPTNSLFKPLVDKAKEILNRPPSTAWPTE